MADKRGLLGMALVALRLSAEIPALQRLEQQLTQRIGVILLNH
jgi:hypothetical protein